MPTLTITDELRAGMNSLRSFEARHDARLAISHRHAERRHMPDYQRKRNTA